MRIDHYHHHPDDSSAAQIAALRDDVQALTHAFAVLSQRITTMSETFSQQLQTISNAVDGIGTDLTAIAQQIADLKANGTLSPADAAAVSAIEQRVAAVKATADALVVPPAPPAV